MNILDSDDIFPHAPQYVGIKQAVVESRAVKDSAQLGHFLSSAPSAAFRGDFHLFHLIKANEMFMIESISIGNLVLQKWGGHY